MTGDTALPHQPATRRLILAAGAAQDYLFGLLRRVFFPYAGLAAAR